MRMLLRFLGVIHIGAVQDFVNRSFQDVLGFRWDSI